MALDYPQSPDPPGEWSDTMQLAGPCSSSAYDGGGSEDGALSGDGQSRLKLAGQLDSLVCLMERLGNMNNMGAMEPLEGFSTVDTEAGADSDVGEGAHSICESTVATGLDWDVGEGAHSTCESTVATGVDCTACGAGDNNSVGMCSTPGQPGFAVGGALGSVDNLEANGVPVQQHQQGQPHSRQMPVARPKLPYMYAAPRGKDPHRSAPAPPPPLPQPQPLRQSMQPAAQHQAHHAYNQGWYAGSIGEASEQQMWSGIGGPAYAPRSQQQQQHHQPQQYPQRPPQHYPQQYPPQSLQQPYMVPPLSTRESGLDRPTPGGPRPRGFPDCGGPDGCMHPIGPRGSKTEMAPRGTDMTSCGPEMAPRGCAPPLRAQPGQQVQCHDSPRIAQQLAGGGGVAATGPGPLPAAAGADGPRSPRSPLAAALVGRSNGGAEHKMSEAEAAERLKAQHQVRLLTHAIQGFGERAWQWAGQANLGAAERYQLGQIMLKIVQPCAHIDQGLQDFWLDLQAELDTMRPAVGEQGLAKCAAPPGRAAPYPRLP